MKPIPVFAQERDDGLAQLIQANRSIAYSAKAEVDAAPLASGRKSELATAAAEKAPEGAGPQPDLFYLKSLMVSTVWNDNDDVFLPEEVWAARASPEDKPFNYQHDQSDIIGHLTGSYVIGDDGVTIADDVAIDELPELMHVISSAVLYRVWKDSDLQKRMNDILTAIPKGDWSVSMECLFCNYDYAIQTADGSTKIVQRNKKSAFLTKKLKAYGGDGTYEKAKVGRVLRDFVFSGKGLVEIPANPYSDSAIFTSASKKIGKIDRLGYSSAFTKNQESPTMPEATEYEKTIAELKADNAKLVAAARESEQKAVEALKNEVASASKKVADATAEATRVAEELKAEKVATATAKKEAETAVASLAKLEADRKHEGRITALKETLGLDAAKAAKAAADLQSLPDEAFVSHLKAQADYMSEKEAEYKKAATAGDKSAMEMGGVKAGATLTTPPKVGTAPTIGGAAPPAGTVVNLAAKKADADMEDDEAKCAAKAALEAATPEPAEAALAAAAGSDRVATVQSHVSAYLAGYVGKQTKTPKKK